MTDLEKAARMALEALGYYEVAGLATTRVAKSITALRQALEQPEYASDADTEELTHLNSLPEPLRLAAMLEKTMQWPLHGKAADCLRKMHAALSEQSAQQQEPVATIPFCRVEDVYNSDSLLTKLGVKRGDNLYTSPQRKPWVGLTWDDMPDSSCDDPAFLAGAQWANSKLKEKNT